MSLPAAPRRPGAYDHARHAGNAADVYKHAALVALVDALRPALVVETHAGRGRYYLGPQGEWQRGIGALLAHLEEHVEEHGEGKGVPPVVTRYLDLLDARPSKKGVRYLGSPLLAARAAPEASLLLHEIDEEAAAELHRALPAAEVVVGDGLAALADLVAPGDRCLVVVDPPYAGKREWHEVVEAVRAFAERTPSTLLLWYPVKTLTRPNALLARLAGLHGVMVESSPHQGRLASGGLVGSGLVVLHPPPGFSDDLVALAGWLTPRLSSRLAGPGGEAGSWSLRARAV